MLHLRLSVLSHIMADLGASLQEKPTEPYRSIGAELSTLAAEVKDLARHLQLDEMDKEEMQ